MTRLSLVLENKGGQLSEPISTFDVPNEKLIEFIDATRFLAKIVPLRVVYDRHVVTSVVITNKLVEIKGKPIVLIPKGGEVHVA